MVLVVSVPIGVVSNCFKVEAKNLLENTDTHILHHTLA